jgi:hypothetical protein
MDNNIIKNILKNLREDVEGKCYEAHGVVTKVHGIKRLFSLEGRYLQRTLEQRHITLSISCALYVNPRRGQLLRERLYRSVTMSL